MSRKLQLHNLRDWIDRQSSNEARRFDDLLQFAQRMAYFTLDGEQDDNGHIVAWDNDCEADTLASCIADARRLLGVVDRPEGDGPCRCPECMEGEAERDGEDR